MASGNNRKQEIRGVAALADSSREQYDADYEWLEANREALLEEYAETWVAIRGCEVIGSAVRLDELIKSMRRRELKTPNSVIEHLTRSDVTMIL